MRAIRSGGYVTWRTQNPLSQGRMSQVGAHFLRWASESVGGGSLQQEARELLRKQRKRLTSRGQAQWDARSSQTTASVTSGDCATHSAGRGPLRETGRVQLPQEPQTGPPN